MDCGIDSPPCHVELASLLHTYISKVLFLTTCFSDGTCGSSIGKVVTSPSRSAISRRLGVTMLLSI